MSRSIANLNVSVDTFTTWLARTNELLTALTTEIITANTGASTGNASAFRYAQLYGDFAGNTIIATTGLRGGNLSSSGLLTISSNSLFTGGFTNAQANVFVNNSVTQINSTSITVTGNSSFRGNSTITNIAVTGNATVTNTVITGSVLFITTSNTQVNSDIITVTGNSSFRGNSTITNIAVTGNATVTNTAIISTNTTINSNLTVTGILHNFFGNSAFNSTNLFVDNATGRIGIGTATPTSVLSVTGAANISLTLGIAGLTTAAAGLVVTGTANVTTGLNVGAFGTTNGTNITNTSILVGNSTANALHNYNLISVANITAIANLSPGILSIGSTTVNGTNINVSTFNATSTINAAGLTGLAGGLVVTGLANLTSGLIVSSGIANLAGSITTGIANVITFNASGLSTLTSGLVVTGQANISAGLVVTGTANVTSNLNVGVFGTTNGTNITNTSILVGNSTANALHNYNLISVANTSFIANLVAGGLNIGTTTVNGTNITVNSLTITGGSVGAVFDSTSLANGSLGATVGTALTIFQFPKATYSSAKMTVQTKSATGNVSISEIVLAAGGTNPPILTVYGSITNPPAANNGVFNTVLNADTINIDLQFTQTSAATATKVVANLIKV